MQKKLSVRPNSTQKHESKNNQIFIPKVSSMIISEKIMQNLLRIPSGHLIKKSQPNQNLSPSKNYYVNSPTKIQKNQQQSQVSNISHNYMVTNSIRYHNPQDKPYLSKSFTKIPSKSGQRISQIITKTINTSQVIRYDHNTLPLHKLITKLKNNSKEKRSVSQLPTMSTDRAQQESERLKQKRKKSVRFYEKVEYLVIGCQEGAEEFKYKFFEPLEKN